MKYSIIWRSHKINCTKVLIRFYMSLTFQQFTRLKAGASLAMSMNHDQTWLNGILSWDKKQTSYSFLFPEFSQSSLILYSPVSGGSCVVAWSCCECELVTVSLDHIQIASDKVITIKISGGKHNNHSYHTNHTLFSFSW